MGLRAGFFGRRATTVIAATAVALPLAFASTSASAQVEPAIPDDGLPPVVIAGSPVVSERTEILEAGVSGLVDRSIDTFPGTQAHVLAFAELNGVMYVGGKFTQVDFAAGGSEPQSFLAAFDRDTGAWIDTFRPTLDGAVWDLKILPDGRLAVAGQFSNVNDVPDTAAIAFIDPVTGEVDPGSELGIQLTGSDRRPLVRAMDVEGDFLYLAGNFTRLTGTDDVERQLIQAGRVQLSTGIVDGTFRPNIDGIVFDIDADGDRVYIVGNFELVNEEFHPGLGVVSATNGELVPDLLPFVRTNQRSYQQAILSLGDEVWMVGSEHNRQVYEASDYSLIRSWVSDPYGDGQAVTELNGVVYTGSHAARPGGTPTDLYRNAIQWRNPIADTIGAPPGTPAIQPIRWMGAFDTSIHEQIPWVPQIGTSGGEGSWELFADSTDCLWTGGDFARGSFDGDTPRFVAGFAKFCAVDQTPPEPPSAPTAELVGDGVNLAWTASPGDDRPGQVRYELLKNDDVFASFISITTFRDPDGTTDDRYFVRAMDEAGNRSATTRVFSADEGPDTSRPTTPQNLAASVDAEVDPDDVTLTWDPSTDDVGVTDYLVLRNGEQIDTVTETTVVVVDAPTGDSWFQIVAVDAAGNQSFRTPPVKVTIELPEVDTSNPTTPSNLAGVQTPDNDVQLTWTASTDNVGVTEYLVLRNGTEIGRTPTPDFLYVDPPTGTSWFQIVAIDAAGNQSFRTSPLQFEVAPDPATDVTNPTTPSNLAGVQTPDNDVQLTWTASTDNVGVTEYLVLRNGTEIGRTPTPGFLYVDPPTGTSWFQIVAIDAAGNQSFRTSPLQFEVAPDPATDVTNPTTPSNLAGVQTPDNDVQLTWTASTDNVGVTEYLVLRNGTEIGRTPTPGFLYVDPPTGTSWFQIVAIDAAGNQSFRTSPLQFEVAPDPATDVSPPTTPQNLTGVIDAAASTADLTWEAATDDVGVTGYIVLRNGVEVAQVDGDTLTATAPANLGGNWYQVRAVDAAGNLGSRTPPLRLDLA